MGIGAHAKIARVVPECFESASAQLNNDDDDDLGLTRSIALFLVAPLRPPTFTHESQTPLVSSG
jgi:hypothetical protein